MRSDSYSTDPGYNGDRFFFFQNGFRFRLTFLPARDRFLFETDVFPGISPLKHLHLHGEDMF